MHRYFKVGQLYRWTTWLNDQVIGKVIRVETLNAVTLILYARPGYMRVPHHQIVTLRNVDLTKDVSEEELPLLVFKYGLKEVPI